MEMVVSTRGKQDTMDADVNTKKKSKKRRKLEKLKMEAKRRKLKAKSKAKEEVDLKEVSMGARLKKRSKAKSKLKKNMQEMDLDEELVGAREKSKKGKAEYAPTEVMDQNGEEMGGSKNISKAKSKEKVDLKKLFRFQSFTERLANIRIDVSHRIGHTTDCPEDRETFFSDALQKWSQLNCTSEFVSFEREVRAKVNTVAQLVYHKDEIISKLKERLLIEQSLAYEPLLDLLVQLARDIQSEFYPYFKEVFPVLVGMCDCQDADLIQCVFTTLAYLLKFLWRQMLKDLGNVFSLYSDLLRSSQRPHIRQFAVESFGFLLRKVRDLEGLVNMLFAEVTKDGELAEGVGQLLFEVCKGVPKQFHSCTEKLFPLLLRQLGSAQYSSSAVFQILTKLTQLMAEHTRAQFSSPVWTPLLAQLKDAHSKWSEEQEDSHHTLALSHTLHLVGVMVSWRNGSRITPGAEVVQPVLKILSEAQLPSDVLSVAVQLAASLILVSSSVPECYAHLSRLVKGVAECDSGRSNGKADVRIVLEFFRELADKFYGFECDILPECLRYCESALQRSDNNLVSILKFLCELCLHFDPSLANRGTIVNLAHSSFSLNLGNLRSLHAYNTRSHQATMKLNIVKHLERLLESGSAIVRSAVHESKTDVEDTLELLWAALVCFQYIRPVEKCSLAKFQDLFAALKDALCSLDKDGAKELVPERKQQLPGGECQLLLLYSQCLLSYVSISNDAVKEKREEDGELSQPIVTCTLQILKKYPSSLPLLCSVCQYSELVTDELICEKFLEVLPQLHKNLSSPSSSMRLVTLQILRYFDQLSTDSTASEVHEDNLPRVNAIEICLAAEEIPAQLQTYRDKLLWLERLKYGAHKFKSTTNRENPEEVPLRYLIGMLYVNFSLLWEPVCEIIRTYAVGEYKKPFWKVFGSFLEEASSLAESCPSPNSTDINRVLWHDSLSSLFCHQNQLMTSLQHSRPDHTNFRIQLWKCVAGFNTEFSESQSRILVPLLLRFVQNEFSLKENNFMESQDIRKAIASTSRADDGNEVTIEEMDISNAVVEDDGDQMEEAPISGFPVDADSEEEGKDDDGQHEEVSTPSSNCGRLRKSGVAKRQLISGRSLNKTLTTILTVFSHFHNPRSFYKDSELRQVYMKLLTHYDIEVQKLAFSCLLTYKPPYLLPYKENFELLLDDSSFREELPNFSMDSECSVVSADHREELLPILIRVLYGRMQKQGGLGSSKSGGNPRRGMVLRFLGGCEGSEMAEFINLLILPFKSLLPASVDSVATKVDAGCVIPLKKQQGFLNMFGQLISILGSKLEPQVSVLFPITLKLGSFCAQLLEQRDQIQPHFVNALKILRQFVLIRVNECYGKFTEFDFSPYQEEVFSALVWPQVIKLPQECIQNPTPLMKLLLTWSQHQQYHSLLGISIPQSIVSNADSDDTSEHNTSILHYVYGCLFAQRVNPKVCSCIMEVTINLLGDYDSINQKQKATKRDAQDSAETAEAGMGMEIQSNMSGPNLVLPLIPKLLGYISNVIESEGKRIKTGSEPRNLHLEFTVISKISQFVKDPDESSHLVQLLLPFLSNFSEKYKRYEEDILMAVVNLSTLVESFAAFYRPISQLFGQISNRQSRSLLCTIFQELSDKDLDLATTASIIQKLNSWDKKHVDEPDYNLRLEGFSDAKRLIAETEEAVSTKGYVILPIVHNALFFLSQSEEMSIRDAAASFVSDFISHIKLQDGNVFQLLVMTTMVAAVKKGLRSKLEFARQEYISVLSQLVKAFPTHPRFSSMAALSHHEPEADFFENVKHIQLHRRTRAFRKLAGLCAEGTLTQACVMNFILPLANHVVFTPVTNTEQNLVAETVKVIGSIATRLSWTNYSFILHHYLRQLSRKLDIQKTLIKVVVAVLDNFHFDLSLARSLHEEEHSTSDAPGEEQRASSQNLSEGDISLDANIDAEDEIAPGDEEISQEELEMEEEGESVRDEKEKSVEEGDQTKQRAMAQKIHKAIVNSILPSLEAVLTKRIDVPGHKLSRLSHEDESNSELLRVPVAMAITKLLLTLPEETLHIRLPSLLLKVCQTLKNRSRDVRDAGRDTLVKMSCALGPKYLRYIVKEMKDMLNRGYMLHVLGYSLHSILRGISSPGTRSPALSPSSSTVPIPTAVPLKSGDLDTCLDLISSILIEDLFGTPAEERESGENVAKIPESKTPQSYNCYEIMAQFLSPQLIPNLLTPVREVLESRSTSRVAHTVEEICRRVSLGIQKNEGFTPQALLVFVHSLLNDSIPQLSSKSASKPHPTSSSSESHDPPEDSRLIPPEPGRSGPKPVSARNVGASIITEFGLQLLHIGLKRGKFDSSSEEQLGMLDPFVPLLAKSLGSHHVKVLSRTLQCLIWIIRMPLPSLGSHMTEISTHLFGLLRRYARAGAAVGSNRELVNSSFKAMTVILRDFRKQDVSEDELTVLLSFVEEDIYDHQRQSTAFPLLKAILGRKFVSNELFELMQKVCQLSVSSDSEHVRQQCRQCILQFMMDYPLGKKLNRYLDFFVINLGYEHQSGRESVIEQLSSIFTKFPERLLNNHATFFFVPLCCQLANEESKTVREMIGETMKTLMSRMDTVRSNEMQRIIESWFKSDQLIQKRLASFVLGLRVEVEGQSFEKRLALFLPLLYECACLYDPSAPDGLCVTEEVAVAEQEEKEADMEESNEDDAGTENGKTKNGESGMDIEPSEMTTSQSDSQATNVRLLDQLLFSVLSTLRKICNVCSVLRGSTHCEVMNQIWEQVQSLLLHPHAWVRLTSSQLYGLLFAGYMPDELVAMAMQERGSGWSQAKGGKSKKRRKSSQKKEVLEYIHQETVTKVQDLSHAFCIQLSSHLLFAELANQSIKNLVFLGKVLHRFEVAGALKPKEREEGDIDGSEEGQKTRDLKWLAERMLRLAGYEAAQHPKESLKRTSVLQWAAAISLDLGVEHLPTYLPTLLRPVYRELADSQKTGGEELHSLAQEVLDLMKGVCGKETFSLAYAQVHQTVLSGREKRRQQAALEAVANPQKSIRRKQRKHKLKRLAKKRQLLFYRPTGTAALAAASRKRLKLKH